MLSVSGLGETTSSYPYVCNATICYGTGGGATHALFKETQYQMNRAGAAIFGTSWKSIDVDGFIGAQTVIAAKLLFTRTVASLATSDFKTFAQQVAQSPWFPNAMRGDADALRPQTAEAPAKVEARVTAYAQEGPAKTANAGALPNVTSPSPNVTVPPTSRPPTAPASAYGPPYTPPAQKGGAIVWVVAGVAVVGLVSAAAYAAKRAKKRR